jgi:peroxiredoxin
VRGAVHLAAVALAFAACAGPAAVRPQASVLPEWGPPQPGDTAPDFELPTLRGGTVKLSSLRGRWVLLHFTATWCPFCDAEVSHLGEIADAHAKDGLAVLLVDEREPLERWTAYAAGKVAPSVEPLYDRAGEAALRFVPPRAHPEFQERADVIFDSTLLIDPQGVIRLFLMPDSAHFDPTFPDVRTELARVFGGPPVRASAAAGGRVDAVQPGQVVSVSAQPGAAAPGAHGELTVTMRIAPGYHTMSDRPSKPNYIATKVTLGESRDVAFGATAWPPSVPFDLGGESIATFQQEAVARVPFDVAAGAGPGLRPVHGMVHYQACTRASCLSPATLPFETTVDVR